MRSAKDTDWIFKTVVGLLLSTSVGMIGRTMYMVEQLSVSTAVEAQKITVLQQDITESKQDRKDLQSRVTRLEFILPESVKIKRR